MLYPIVKKPTSYLLILASMIYFSSSYGIGKSSSPDLWQFKSQREALAPVSYVDSVVLFKGAPTLVLAGGGNELANGHWFSDTEVVPNTHYHFQVHYQSEKVEEQKRCILARILWYDQSGEQTGQAEYPASVVGPAGNWNIIEQVYLVPEGVTKAKIELVYRWDPDGVVHFGGVLFAKSKDPGTRSVRLATVHHRPENSSGPTENLQQFSELIAKAAAQHADIVCLPEGVTLVGTELNYISASEPVPGPTTKYLGEIAKKHKLYIVAGILEKLGDAVYNTSVLIDRNGELAGKYHKVSLPREEIDGGVTPGDALPVFDTDFGKIGMMICWDVTFPETARTLALQGAEVIFLPIWGGHLTLAKARALENQVYLVSSSYDMESAVFDLEGEIMEEASKENPVIVVEVDLNNRINWPWLGDFKNRIPREIPSQKALDIRIE